MVMKWYLTMVLVCISLTIRDVECHLYIFFGEMSIQIICPFFNQVVWILLLCFKSSSYILDINPLWFANIFSQPVGFLFTLLTILFAHKLLILIFSNLPIFPFVACGFGVTSEKSLPNPTSWSFSYDFFWGFYWFSSYIWSLTHFELIF